MPKPDSRAMALVTIESKHSAPTLATAAAQLGVAVEDLDVDFGVVTVDPAHGLYSVRVRADRLARGFAERRPYRGPFAEPPIAPVGPVEDRPKK